MPLHLDHVNLVVRDLPAQTAFYVDQLGFRPLLQRELSGPWVASLVGCPGAVMHCVILEPPGGGPRLELLAYQHPAAVALPDHGLPAALGLRHLALAVDDLDAAVARLTAAGVPFLSDPVTVPFRVAGRRKRLVYFRDPEGVLVELAEYAEVV